MWDHWQNTLFIKFVSRVHHLYQRAVADEEMKSIIRPLSKI
jgi:hypothetical protein